MFGYCIIDEEICTILLDSEFWMACWAGGEFRPRFVVESPEQLHAITDYDFLKAVVQIGNLSFLNYAFERESVKVQKFLYGLDDEQLIELGVAGSWETLQILLKNGFDMNKNVRRTLFNHYLKADQLDAAIAVNAIGRM